MFHIQIRAWLLLNLQCLLVKEIVKRAVLIRAVVKFEKCLKRVKAQHPRDSCCHCWTHRAEAAHLSLNTQTRTESPAWIIYAEFSSVFVLSPSVFLFLLILFSAFKNKRFNLKPRFTNAFIVVHHIVTFQSITPPSLM